MRSVSAALAAALLVVAPQANSKEAKHDDIVSYDTVLMGGRVIDPESGLDTLTNVAITNGKVAAIGDRDYHATTTIDVSGLIVSPGFIDLHSHAQSLAGQTYQVMDGVTTALDLEVGNVLGISDASRFGKSLIHYGYSASHWRIRQTIKGGNLSRGFHESLNGNEPRELLSKLEQEMESGAIGIGLGLDYFSKGVSQAELQQLFELAGKYQQPLFIHTRVPDDINDLTGVTELIDMARTTQAPLHIVHITSTSLKRTEQSLRLIDLARAEGLDISTEVYPYTAGSTGIGFGIFDHNWQKKLGISYRDVERASTGQRFTDKKSWDALRKSSPNEQVILHMIDEAWIKKALHHPEVLVASDAMPIKALDQRVHPRGIGTFSRLIHKYVKTDKTLSLMAALRKITLLPAKRLEQFVPSMRHKGRINLGADADITVFDLNSVQDNATFSDPNRFSSGIRYVLVNGQLVVREGAIISDSFPGQKISAIPGLKDALETNP